MFGTSNIVWANVIGLILLFLAIGYFVGGRWADRSANFTTFYRLLIWDAFLCALIPLIARPVLVVAGNAVAQLQAALVLGSFFSVLLLFALPITLLGCASPFAIRLAVTNQDDLIKAGSISGRLYALSTIGSLFGTFLPTLVLVDRIGTMATFLLFAGVLYGVALIGLWQHRGKSSLMWLWMPVVIGLLALLILNGPLRQPFSGARLLYERETAYNYIQVQEDETGNRYLYLNEGQGIHSQWSPNTYADNHRTWSFFLTAPYFNAPPFKPSDVQSLAIIGLAGGTIARQHIAVYGNIPIDGIEIDPGIVEAGARYFDISVR